MKKKIFLFAILLISSTTFAQNKPKSKKEVRDSIYTVMKLSNNKRLLMEDLIEESGKGQGVIKKDQSLTEEQKKEKINAVKNVIFTKQKELLTPQELEDWKNITKSLNSKLKQ